MQKQFAVVFFSLFVMCSYASEEHQQFVTVHDVGDSIEFSYGDYTVRPSEILSYNNVEKVRQSFSSGDSEVLYEEFLTKLQEILSSELVDNIVKCLFGKAQQHEPECILSDSDDDYSYKKRYLGGTCFPVFLSYRLTYFS